ncbi:MAG: SAM-dependent methyltransferase, partial [Bacteroidetes bacterium]
CRERFGEDRFYSFYRTFLLRLFHDGLACKEDERTPEITELLGDIPYLNGGIFQPHELERAYDAIDIPDEAFEKVFAFFDQYQWHLDYRPLQNDREINPDVLGYIFEQFVNQKQMGAYYTKEDITGYICRNTILPFLFDEARKGCREAFEGEGSIWKLLQEDPDRYIYPAVRHGIYDDEGNRRELPPEIADGLDTSRPNLIERRKAWNTLAPPDYALPTEIWREVVARRRRYDEVRGKLERGEVRDINDFITFNLNIEQFAQDVIERCEGPYLLRAFCKALKKVTILDPTCGSGAFLFAALEILEPLYVACLTRMQAFVEDLERSGEKHSPKKFEDFRKVLDEAFDETKHPNLDYYVYKSIILNNLYGVDIMEEAVEICKLRLFLKLAAQVERKEDLEPLPDIDFNIKAGNTLVGYATLEEARRAVQSKLDFDDAWTRIEEKAMDVAILAEQFREQQTTYGGEVTAEDKRQLRERLAALTDELNGYLAAEYGVKKTDAEKYQAWLASHKPFHWFVEFYGIMSNGGFDVIVGNPPYNRLYKVRKEYEIIGYETLGAGDIYAPMLERALQLSNSQQRKGRLGFIVPLSLSATHETAPLRNVIFRSAGRRWFSHYSGDAHPAKLFEGVKYRLDIILADRGKVKQTFSSPYLKWAADERDVLFSNKVSYAEVSSNALYLGLIPKNGSCISNSILDKLFKRKAIQRRFGNSSDPIYVHRVITMYVKCFDFVPYFWNETDGQKKSDDYKPYTFRSKEYAKLALPIINSSTFFYYFISLGDCFHCGKKFVGAFPVDLDAFDTATSAKLVELGATLMRDLQANAVRKVAMSKKTGRVEYDEFWPRESKPIIDEIDRVLARHYGFTDEELDFIINYDIKYRMGLGNLGEDEAGDDEAEE